MQIIDNYSQIYALRVRRAILVVILVISAVLMIAESAISESRKKVIVGPFQAQYYSENDGKSPGRGNDGTIKGIVPDLKFTETVTRPAMNFSYSDFHGINSHNFYGVWGTTIRAAHKEQSIKAHFDVSKADVSIYINNKLVEKWRDDSKSVQLNLKKGENKIRVELHNHWHTTSFNVSFTDYEKLDKAAAVDLFAGIDFSSTKAVYLGAYEASSRNRGEAYNEILVTLPSSPDPVFIFLNSYRAVNWVINNPHNTKILGTALQGRSPGSTVTTSTPIPIYELPANSNGYKSAYEVRTYIGRNADYAFMEYGFSKLVVPDFFPLNTNSRVQTKNVTTPTPVSGTNDKEYGVNAFVETLEIIQRNGSTTKTRLTLEPDLNATFTQGSWKGYFDIPEDTVKSYTITQKGIRVELIIDGRSVWRGKKSGEKVYQHTFKKGRHQVMFVASPIIESKPAQLKVSITDHAKSLEFAQLSTYLKKLGDFESIYCGVQKSSLPDRNVDIMLEESKRRIVLFLSSYKQVVWNFRNSKTDKLAAVVTSAKSTSASFKNLPSHIPVYHFSPLANTSRITPINGMRNIKNTFKNVSLQILSLTGNLPTGFSGAAQTDTLTVPEIHLDRHIYLGIGFTNISKGYNTFIEYPKKIDIVFNPVATKQLDPNSTSKFARARQIKPKVQRPSWAAPLRATKDIPTGAFKAYYFDIFTPGQPKFSGIVENVSINSSGRTKLNSEATARVDEYGIIPENFGGFWIGNIDLGEDKELEVNIDQSNSATRLLIDDKVITGKKLR